MEGVNGDHSGASYCSLRTRCEARLRSPLVQEDNVIVDDGVCKRKGLQTPHNFLSSQSKLCSTASSTVIPLTGHHHPEKCEHQRRATHVPAAATDALILGRMQLGAHHRDRQSDCAKPGLSPGELGRAPPCPLHCTEIRGKDT